MTTANLTHSPTHLADPYVRLGKLPYLDSITRHAAKGGTAVGSIEKTKCHIQAGSLFQM
jgi:hypothetical protein